MADDWNPTAYPYDDTDVRAKLDLVEPVVLSLADRLCLDLVIYGTATMIRRPDGAIERVDPSEGVWQPADGPKITAAHEEEMHYADHGVAGGFPHRASECAGTPYGGPLGG